MRAAVGGLVLITVLVAGCGGGGTDPGGGGGGSVNTCPSTSASISVNDNSFTPGCTTVAPGTTVTWTWGANVSNNHNVTFPGGPSSNTQTSGTFQRTFSQAGTFSYTCTVHAGMSGQVRVQ